MEEELRRRAEEEENRGKQNVDEGFILPALVNLKNAEDLWEEVGDLARVQNAQNERERIKKLWWSKK